VSTGWEDANEAIDAAVAGGRAHVNGERAKASKDVRDREATRRETTQICARLAHRRSPAMLPILGTLSLEHLRKNLAALEIELTDAELDALR
jgi:aryl-alcohol dehydrogenase-like predicted oxidoreductase